MYAQTYKQQGPQGPQKLNFLKPLKIYNPPQISGISLLQHSNFWGRVRIHNSHHPKKIVTWIKLLLITFVIVIWL